jgi:hypothetical protein
MRSKKGRSGRSRRFTALAVFAAVGSLGLLSGASAALAKTEPNPEFLPFVNCPIQNKAVRACIVSTVTSGEFTLGNKTVPIAKPITLQGGLEEGSTELIPASNGETLSKTPLVVPGGLVGLELGAPTEVTATTELAGPVQVDESKLAGGNEAAVTLPIKVKLDNPVLGAECYVGSEASPIVLHLTTGTTSPPAPNKPITGNPGTLTVNPELTIFTITGNSLVDNSFSAPGASGCGGALSAVVDEAVNLQVGLPAEAGHNTGVLNGTIQETFAKPLKKSKVIKKPKKTKKTKG